MMARERRFSESTVPAGPASRYVTCTPQRPLSRMDRTAVKAPPAPPAEDIPEGLEADLAPLHPEDRPADDNSPYHQDTLEAQRAFDAAADTAKAGREDDAVHQFLTAAKLAEAAHEWYLAALAF